MLHIFLLFFLIFNVDARPANAGDRRKGQVIKIKEGKNPNSLQEAYANYTSSTVYVSKWANMRKLHSIILRSDARLKMQADFNQALVGKWVVTRRRSPDQAKSSRVIVNICRPDAR